MCDGAADSHGKQTSSVLLHPHHISLLGVYVQFLGAEYIIKRGFIFTIIEIYQSMNERLAYY